eukprot:9542662-Alexandrium_andersonii.AAC.1
MRRISSRALATCATRDAFFEHYTVALQQHFQGAIYISIAPDASRIGKRGRLVSPVMNLDA